MERERKERHSERLLEECRRPLAAVGETFGISAQKLNQTKGIRHYCVERAKLLVTVQHLLRK